ncbi:hypothetical protein [Candidatus Endomicrobiellum devescovinae]|jgi:hypothetical protein|uniref:hypothetical protein n=1 Tax=Candidatus Endomicrobiellum devescovinae TaxID=3242322 RepID=UPI00282E3008|nr:hypothetical protein [Endomicrobium sp.]MDR1434146.1 hypothetical protein [Endomicrobium sp.]
MNCKYSEIPFCDESTVSRFINDRRHLKKDDIIKITPNAFIYPKENKTLSLVHINNLTESEIWDISDTKIFKNVRLSSREKFKTVARADMNVGKLKSLQIDGFDIKRDDTEFERHVTAISNMEKQVFAVKLSLNCEAKMRY